MAKCVFGIHLKWRRGGTEKCKSIYKIKFNAIEQFAKPIFVSQLSMRVCIETNISIQFGSISVSSYFHVSLDSIHS